MCKFSIEATTIQAKQGQILAIGNTKTTHVPPNTFGTFKAKGTTATCFTCVKDGTVLTLLDVPPEVQKKYKIGARQVVTMVDNDLYNEDQVRVEQTDALIPLIELAGASAYVGKLESTDEGAGLDEPTRSREPVRA